MKDFSEQLHTQAITSVRLDEVEMRTLRNRVEAYMDYYPLASIKQSHHITKRYARTSSLWARTVAVVSGSLLRTSLTAAVVVVLIVPFLAEQAVPGDTLYAIKVRFNEEIRSSLTFDAYQKVEWETERLNRRIAEARLLANEGRLTEEVEAEVAEAVRTHTENAKREIEELRVEDADEAVIASIALDTTLAVQATSLRGELAGGAMGGAASTTELIAAVIDESRDQSLDEQATSTVPAYEKLMARVEQNTTRVYELRDSIRPMVPEEKMLEVDRRITDVERAIATVVQDGTFDGLQKRRMLVDVLQRTQRLVVYMTELEVTETIDIESIVPVVLTAEEKASEVERRTTLLLEKSARIAELLDRVPEEESGREDFTSLQNVLQDLLAQMASSTTDFIAFSTYATDASDVADDLLTHLAPYEVPVQPGSATSTDPLATSSVATTLPEIGTTTASTATSSVGEVESIAPTSTEVGTHSTSSEGIDSE